MSAVVQTSRLDAEVALSRADEYELDAAHLKQQLAHIESLRDHSNLGHIRLIQERRDEVERNARRAWDEGVKAAYHAWKADRNTEAGSDADATYSGEFSVEIEDLLRRKFAIDAQDLRALEAAPLKHELDEEIAAIRKRDRDAVVAARAPVEPEAPEESATEREIATLTSQKPKLALAALGGGVKAASARAELSNINVRIAELTTLSELEELAGIERTRLALEAEAKAEAEAQRVLQTQIDELSIQHAALVADCVESIGWVAARFEALVPVNREYAALAYNTSDDFGRDHTEENLVMVLHVALLDRGVHPRALPEMPYNAQKEQIRALFPIPNPLASNEPEAKPTPRKSCAACDSEHRAGIDAAIGAKVALRTVEADFGLSRSTLARHRYNCLGITEATP